MLNISEHTFNEHLRHMALHIGKKNMPQTIVFALLMGLV
jgi:hypothetical protein